MSPSTLSSLVSQEPQCTVDFDQWKYLVSLAQLCRWESLAVDEEDGLPSLFSSDHGGEKITLLRTSEAELYVLNLHLIGFVTLEGAEQIITEARNANPQA